MASRPNPSILQPPFPDPPPTSGPPSLAPAHPIREVLHDQSRHGSQVPLASDSRTPKRRLLTTFTPPLWAPPFFSESRGSLPEVGVALLEPLQETHTLKGRAKPERLHSTQAQLLRQVLERLCPARPAGGTNAQFAQDDRQLGKSGFLLP